MLLYRHSVAAVHLADLLLLLLLLLVPASAAAAVPQSLHSQQLQLQQQPPQLLLALSSVHRSQHTAQHRHLVALEHCVHSMNQGR
jgi:hypothetical protein